MKFNDFEANFRNLYYCRIFDPAIWHEYSLRSKWGPESSGGCSNFKDTFAKNPQYKLVVKKTTTCFFMLQQEEKRGSGEEEFAIGVSIYSKDKPFELN
jgi:hypothetical protein